MTTWTLIEIKYLMLSYYPPSSWKVEYDVHDHRLLLMDPPGICFGLWFARGQQIRIPHTSIGGDAQCRDKTFRRGLSIQQQHKL